MCAFVHSLNFMGIHCSTLYCYALSIIIIITGILWVLLHFVIFVIIVLWLYTFLPKVFWYIESQLVSIEAWSRIFRSIYIKSCCINTFANNAQKNWNLKLLLNSVWLSFSLLFLFPLFHSLFTWADYSSGDLDACPRKYSNWLPPWTRISNADWSSLGSSANRITWM